MLSAREQEIPGEIQQQAYATAALVTTALFVLMLVGPNVLSEKEILARMTTPPRRSWAAPGSLNELTDLDHSPWAHAQVLHEPDAFGGHQVRQLLATPRTARGNSFTGYTPSVAA
ncbi:MAG TPA: hypothetical protein VGL47_38790 [Amycolatopsis sp.]|uniref:Uncharacterized protein n=1 Tax=Amycolatopsis nalaikhensis TaxID=715472 RepID=A0ABY8XEE2_9PSEU|nr:hypothetical protein [Amycolatopsis sp. 2-2]WIV53989.1 hypothetical protein QP939_34670 [Amycolatopsis sp. 2-2]